MIKNMKVSKKIVLSFVMILFATIFAGGFTVFNILNIKAMMDKQSSISQNVFKLGELEIALVSSERTIRNFMLSGDRSLVKNIEDESEKVNTIFNTLESKANNVFLSDLKDIHNIFNVWQSEIVAKQIDLMGNANTLEQARMMVVAGFGEKYTSEIYEKLDGVISQYQVFEKESIEALNKSEKTALISTISGNVVAIFIAIFSAIMLSKTIARPIKNMTSLMTTLADGNHNINIPDRDRKDEIGDMASAVEIFRENMIKNEEMAAKEKEEQALRVERAERLVQITSDFDKSIADVLSVLDGATNDLKDTSSGMKEVSKRTHGEAGEVATVAQQANSNVSTVAAAAEELSSSISEISRQVQVSARMSTEASDKVQIVDKKVSDLSAAAVRINDVVEMINDIASKTNLLALNATIEAARAGEAGKGFAVVASEVKTLANQTAKATEQITQHVISIQEETNLTAEAIRSISESVMEVQQVAESIAAAVEEQGVATQEIAHNVQEASSGTDSVSQLTLGLLTKQP